MRIPLNHRPVLSAALGAGLAAGCLVAPWLATSTALLAAWCAAAAVHLALSLRTMARTTPEAARRRAALLDTDKWATLGAPWRPASHRSAPSRSTSRRRRAEP